MPYKDKTTQRKRRNRFKNAKPTRPHAQSQWYRRMKIWHALNDHGGMLIMEIAQLTGITVSQVSDDLKEMGGVRRERANAASYRWYVKPD